MSQLAPEVRPRANQTREGRLPVRQIGLTLLFLTMLVLIILGLRQFRDCPTIPSEDGFSMTTICPDGLILEHGPDGTTPRLH